MYQPAALHAFLKSLQITPSKHLSQNFLIDGNIVTRIVDACRCKEGDLVLEIGSGPGALTEGLLKRGVKILAIEKDRAFANALPRLDQEGAHLTVFAEDATKAPLQDMLQEGLAHSPKGAKAYVAANLPYHLTTPLLMRLLPLQAYVHSLTLMVQKELSERLVAQVGQSAYGWLAPYSAFFGSAKILFPVGRQLFFPKPNVDSVVIQVLLHEPVFQGDKAALFLDFLLAGFSAPRKMLRSRWTDSCPKEEVEAALVAVGCVATARPEEISYKQWLELFVLLEPKVT